MSNYSKVTRVLVGDGANSATPVASLATIQKGDLVLLDSKNNILTATTAAAVSLSDIVVVAMGTGPGKYIKSSAIEGNTVNKYIGTEYAAPVQHEIALGYDGVDAGKNFVVTAGDEYRLRVLIKDSTRPNWMRSTIADANVLVKTGGTALDAALELQGTILQKDKGFSFLGGQVKIEVITNGTDGDSGDYIVSNGSKQITSAAHGLTGGTYIRLAGVTYKVAKVVDANTIMLNAAYQGASSASEAGTPVTAITLVGIKATGIPVDGFEGIDEYEIINFNAVLTGADDDSNSQYEAPVTILNNIFHGQGYWKQVFDSEMTSRGYLGAPMDRISYDAKLVESNVVKETGYGSIIIDHSSVHMADWNYRQHSPLQTEIYIADGGSQGDADTATSFTAILNAYITQGGRHNAIDLVPGV